MKRAIEVSEIRAGDTVRYEPGSDYNGTLIGTDYRAERDEQAYLPKSVGGQHYLLDRPTPAVALPVDGQYGPGWITDDHSTTFGDFLWRKHHVEDGPIGQIMRDRIVAWVPAVPVPKAALEELRKIHLSREGCGELKCGSYKDVTRFLAAIEALS